MPHPYTLCHESRSYIFTLIILVACGYGCSNHIVEQDERQDVVLIFKDAPEQISTMRFLGKLSVKGRGTVNYVDSSLTLVEYVPKEIGYDTITVPAFGGYAEILHTYQAIEDIPYLLMAGDTVLFTYGSDLRPRPISLVSERNTNVYNILWNDPGCVQPCGYSTKTILSSVEYQRAFELWNELDRSTPESIVKKSANCILTLTRFEWNMMLIASILLIIWTQKLSLICHLFTWTTIRKLFLRRGMKVS